MTENQIKLAREIFDAKSGFDFVPFNEYPQPGEYVVTQIQADNFNGEKGWGRYIGYVVQVRVKAGAFGSDMVFLRHPDGTLVNHENQCYYRLPAYWLAKAVSLYPPGMTPDDEDYSKPYTMNGSEYPEVGKVINNPKPGYKPNENPMMKITVDDGNSHTVIFS